MDDRALDARALDAFEKSLRIDALPVREVVLDSLRTGNSPRSAGLDVEHVKTLAQIDVPFPPIVVHRRTMRIIDGAHRAAAARRRGDRVIGARMFDGDDEAAFLLAVRANVTHGMPLTLAERTAAASRILRSHPHLSDRAIANTAGLSAATVRVIRERFSFAATGDTGRRLGRDGRLRPMDAVQGRRLAAAVLSERPDASLREIARAAGVSPGTARDVRERVRRGDSPIPARAQRDPHAIAPDRPARVSSAVMMPAGAMPADPATLVQNLRRDPSLRFSESGRALLAWLTEHAIGVDRWSDLVAQVPAHCTYPLADIARRCEAEWRAFAEEMTRRADIDGGPTPIIRAERRRKTVA